MAQSEPCPRVPAVRIRDRATLLPPTVLSPYAARAFTCQVVESWQRADLRDDLVLVVDELVTNAVRYAPGGPIMVALRIDSVGLRVEVSDACDTAPNEESPTDTRLGGRGMNIVAALCEAWGTRRNADGGKTVWATLSSGHRPPS